MEINYALARLEDEELLHEVAGATVEGHGHRTSIRLCSPGVTLICTLCPCLPPTFAAPSLPGIRLRERGGCSSISWTGSARSCGKRETRSNCGPVTDDS